MVNFHKFRVNFFISTLRKFFSTGENFFSTVEKYFSTGDNSFSRGDKILISAAVRLNLMYFFMFPYWVKSKITDLPRDHWGYQRPTWPQFQPRFCLYFRLSPLLLQSGGGATKRQCCKNFQESILSG